MSSAPSSQRTEEPSPTLGGTEGEQSALRPSMSASNRGISDWDKAERRSTVRCIAKYRATATVEYWGLWATPGVDLDTDYATTSAAFAMSIYEIEGLFGRRLWSRFRSDFEGWGEEHFDLINQYVRTGLKNFLLSHGVFLDSEAGPIRTMLKVVMESGRFRVWREDKLDEAIAIYPELNERLKAVWSRRDEITSDIRRASTPLSQPLSDARELEARERARLTATPSTQDRQPTLGPDVAALRAIAPKVATSGAIHDKPLATGEEIDADTMKKRIEAVQKTFDKTPTMKYGGERYEILDSKANAFRFECDIQGLNRKGYAMAFNRMLKGDARKYYLDHVHGNSDEFNIAKAMAKVRSHFETKERRQ